MSSTREYEVKCHACGQHTRTMTIANPKYWAIVANMKAVRAHGGFSDSRDTGRIRTASIGDHEFRFIESEVQEHWPELASLFEKEDSCLV